MKSTERTRRVTLTLDNHAAARDAASSAVDFIARQAGIPEHLCRGLTAAFSEAGRLMNWGGHEGPGCLRCAVASREGEVRLRLAVEEPSPGARARTEWPARRALTKSLPARWKAIQRKVSRIEWGGPSGRKSRSSATRPSVLIVQRG